jgi:hypothetical protein
MTQKHFIIAIAILLVFISGVFAYKHYNKTHELKPAIMSKEDVLKPEKVRDFVNKNSDANLNNYQAQQVVRTVERIIETDRKPNNVSHANGSNYGQVATDYAKKHKADATIVTPAPNETKKMEDIKPDDNVTLNQYNVYAYPKRQVSVAYYADGDKTLDLEYQMKLFGKHVYAGPTIKMSKDGSVTAGAKLTIPF